MPTRLTHNLPATSALPKVAFKVVDLSARKPQGVADRQAESFGFNDGSEWEFPEGYIRWIQPDETDLSQQVEYDMDEQDQEWLSALNAERRRDGIDTVSYEFFEIVMDKLEKEWFDLTRRTPSTSAGPGGTDLPAEDSKCCICEDGDCENSNAIVFCDGCNLAVHQDCYGVPYIPEGQWLCRKCTVSPDKPVSCILCPAEFGAFKQTTSNAWAHLLCAIWVPETGVSNTVYMEPIDGVENIPKSRWKLVCYLCKKKTGACIQCSNKNCFTAFHVTCAREYGLYLKLKPTSAHYDGPSENKAYCHKHAPKDHATSIQNEIEEEEKGKGDRGGRSGTGTPMTISKKRKRNSEPPPPQLFASSKKKLKLTKSARAYKKSYSFGPPLVPAYIYNRISEYVEKVKVRKKQQLLGAICRYWSLKREARRGAPLLKRLHLEPWTASASHKQQTDDEKAKKLQYIVSLRSDLEKVRMLAELVRKREKEKLKRAQMFKTIMDGLFFPADDQLRDVLHKVAGLDHRNLFLNPVNKSDVPDYFDIVKVPMDWATMSDKLEWHEYHSAKDFKDDVELIFSNAMLYNRPDTQFYKAAKKLQLAVQPILSTLDHIDRPGSSFRKHKAGLGSLLDAEKVKDLLAINYDMPKPKPPVVPKTPKVKESKKRKRDEPDSIDRAPGFRAPPRTRRLIAAEAALFPEPEAPAEDETLPGGTEDGEGETSDRPMTKAERRRENERKAKELRDAKREIYKERAKERKAAAPVVPSLPPIVADVDSRNSFSLFNAGWVLPEGSTRRGRATFGEGSESAGSRAASRASTSRLSKGLSPSPMLSLKPLPPLPAREITPGQTPLVPPIKDAPTPAFEREASVRTESSELSELPEDTDSEEDLKAGDQGEVGEGDISLTPRAKEVGVGEEDSPAKVEVDVQETPDDLSSVTVRPEDEATARKVDEQEQSEAQQEALPPTPNRTAGEMASERLRTSEGPSLQATIDPETNADPNDSPKTVKQKAKTKYVLKQELDKLTPLVAVGKNKKLEDGLLVWAKMQGYPYYPAEVSDPDAEDVPDDALDERPEDDRDHFLVMFFDRQRTWKWIERTHLRYLGENARVDAILRMNQMCGKQANHVREAYEKALKNMEVEADVGASEPAGTSGTAGRERRTTAGGRKKR